MWINHLFCDSNRLNYKITSKNPFNLERKYINLNIPNKTGSRLWKIIITDVWSYWTRKCAVINLKISQLVLELLAKYGFSAAILKFPDETGCSFFYLIYFSNHYHRTGKFTFRIFKISQLVLEFLAFIRVFGGYFEISWRNRK